MPESRHTYETKLAWTEGKRGIVRAGERAEIHVGVPPEFGGDAVSWSPEHLYVASVNACLMATFLVVAANSKMPFRSYEATATGELEKVEGRGFVFTRIVVRPRIAVPVSVDRARVEQIVRLSKRNCYISNSLTAEVVVEPDIVTD